MLFRSITRCHPFEEANKTSLHNPLGKIPILLLENETLFDSGVISKFIDSLVDPEKRLIPQGESERRECFRLICLADGIMDCAVELRIQALRFPDLKPDWWTERKLQAIFNTLDWFEANPLQGLTMASLALVCALSYLEFRHSHLNWKGAYPKLKSWYQHVSQRNSVRQTQFKD